MIDSVDNECTKMDDEDKVDGLTIGEGSSFTDDDESKTDGLMNKYDVVNVVQRV